MLNETHTTYTDAEIVSVPNTASNATEQSPSQSGGVAPSVHPGSATAAEASCEVPSSLTELSVHAAGTNPPAVDGTKNQTPDNDEMLVRDQALRTLADKINADAPDVEDKSIALGKMILEARKYFRSGTRGNPEWKEWIGKNIALRESRVRDLMRIAKAKDPVAEKKKQKAKGAKRQKKHRNKHEAAALAASAKSDSLSDVAESPEPDEHQVLTEKIVAVVRNWALGKSVPELQRVISEITDSGDGFPEMPAFLIRNKSALAASAKGGAVT